MDATRFQVMLHCLKPTTLAYLARDLAASQADWRSYPEEAPPEAIRQALAQTREAIVALGTKLAEAEGLDFQQMLRQAIEAEQQEDWAWQRDRQEQQNWTQDLE